MNPDTIAEAVWTNATRTLSAGVAAEPTTRAEEIAKAVWEYMTRTLTEVEAQGLESWIRRRRR